jgi:hypothetical protein
VIFFRAVDLLVREKIEVPGYFRLAALILRAINPHFSPKNAPPVTSC